MKPASGADALQKMRRVRVGAINPNVSRSEWAERHFARQAAAVRCLWLPPPCPPGRPIRGAIGQFPYAW